jgi:hypothetical protein
MKMRKTKDIIEEIEDDLNQDIYDVIAFENYNEESRFEEVLMKGYIGA